MHNSSSLSPWMNINIMSRLRIYNIIRFFFFFFEAICELGQSFLYMEKTINEYIAIDKA